MRFLLLLTILVAIGVTLVLSQRTEPAAVVPATTARTNLQTYQVKGLVVALGTDGKSVKIKHEEIPGYMAAMTMEFEVRGTNELTGLTAGDTVAFRMLVTDDDGWIDQLRKLDAPKVNPPTPLPEGIRIVRDVEPLEVGDLLPEYRFTNQSGKILSTLDYRGRALVISFIFTRCPFPTYCPRITSGFADAQQLLLTNHPSLTNWHLLSLTIDPEYDTPAILKDYAQRHGGVQRYWTYATGSLLDLTAIAEQFGLQFWRDTPGGLPNHNLRAAVIDAAGRVQTNLVGNTWTGDQLAEEIIKAARVKSP
jgi:protein SCO1/2